MGPLLLFSGSWCMQHFVCAIQDHSLSFPQYSGSPAIKSCWPASPDSLGIPSPFVAPPGWEAWCGFRTFTTVGELFWYYCSPVCGSSTQGVQDWFYCDCAPPTVLLRILLCLWTWGFVWFVCLFFFFGDFQHPPVDGCSTDRCNFGALGGGNEHRSFYSTVWNQKPCGWYLQLGKGPQLRLRWKNIGNC